MNRYTATIALAAAAVVGSWAFAQQLPTNAAPDASAQPGVVYPNPPAQAGDPNAQPNAPTPLPQGELDQLLAPVALYPDTLLSQVLMASTYPLEIVQARRFVDANPTLQGDALGQSLAQQPWDPSVKSLITTPTVLKMLDERLDWTIKLGDAFLADQQRAMDTVQRLRADAQRAGYLQSNAQQQVTVAPAPAPEAQPVAQPYYDQPQPTQTIVIENSSPDTYYVPVYDPGVVYGTWAYANYRPFYWRPQGYVTNAPYFYARPCPIGPAWSYAWGRPDWRDRRVDLNFTVNARYNRFYDRDDSARRVRERIEAGDRGRVVRGNDPRHDAGPVCQHDNSHRLGVAYRDPAIARQYTGRGNDNDVRAREAFRGRPENVVGPAERARRDNNGDGKPDGGDRAVAPDPANRPADRQGRRDASQNPIAPNVAQPGRSAQAAPDRAAPDRTAPNRPTPQPTPARVAPQPADRTRDRTAPIAPQGNGDAARAESARGRSSRGSTPMPAPQQQAPARQPTPAPAPRVAPAPTPAPAAPRGSAPAQPTPAPRAAPSDAGRGSAPAAPSRGGDGGGAGAARGGSGNAGGGKGGK